MTVKVAGMFNVKLDVLDISGGSATSIDSLTLGCRNVVTIKNICTLPKQVAVDVSLLSGTTSLEFLVKGSSQPQWRDMTTIAVAGGGTATLWCSIERTLGPSSLSEPIQLNGLWNGDGPPKPLTPVSSTRIPFQITIDAV